MSPIVNNNIHLDGVFVSGYVSDWHNSAKRHGIICFVVVVVVAVVAVFTAIRDEKVTDVAV